MDTTFAVTTGGLARRSGRTRVMSVIAALALVLAAFVLVQQPAEAAPQTASVAAAVAGGAAVGSVTPQFENFICGILLSLRAAFENSPFFAFILPIIDSLLVAFGCEVSPG